MRIVNNIKNALWNSGLIIVFLAANIVPIITANIIEVPFFDYDNNLFGASVFIITGCALTFLGYYVSKPSRPYASECKASIALKGNYLYVMSSLAIFGGFIAFKTLTAVSDLNVFQNFVIDGEEVNELRYDMGHGGLGGILKMFASMPLCVFLINSSLFFFTDYDYKSSVYIKKVMIVSLIATLFKVAIYFDRLSLLAVLFVFTYHFFYNKKMSSLFKIIIVGGIVLIAALITTLRMGDISLFQFLGAYFNLGVINLQIVIDKQTEFNYLFTETFLCPLSFIFKFFGLPFSSITACDYVWNTAQSFWGFYYVDTHYFGLLLLPLLGKLIKFLELSKFNKPFCSCFYFIAMYTLFSFCVVPIIRSIEFWLMIVTCIIIKNKLINYNRNICLQIQTSID